MKRRLLYLCLVLVSFGFLLASCSDDNGEDNRTVRTYILLFPWTGNEESDTGLLSNFYENLSNILLAINDQQVLHHERVLVYLQTSKSTATLREIVYTNGKSTYQLLKEYQDVNCAEQGTICRILTDAQGYAPANEYALMMGAHGCGWTYVSDWNNYPYNARMLTFSDENGNPVTRMSNTTADNASTRFFGSSNAQKYEIDVEMLADEIGRSGMHLRYILFDICYMGNIETAYALRKVTDYIIASPSEIMAYGMPYRYMWKYLTGSINYEGACKAFYDFYSTFSFPYGCLATINCSEVDQMVSLMKRINQTYQFDETQRSSLQALDGFKRLGAGNIFFDFEDYVSHLVTDEALLTEYRQEMKRLVPYYYTTSELPTNLGGGLAHYPVSRFSGLSISDPSNHVVATRGIQKTGWYQATH